METPNYQSVLELATSLGIEDRRRLMEAVWASIDHKEKTHSITELRGPGKEIWKGIDAQEYVNGKRASWRR